MVINSDKLFVLIASILLGLFLNIFIVSLRNNLITSIFKLFYRILFCLVSGDS